MLSELHGAVSERAVDDGVPRGEHRRVAGACRLPRATLRPSVPRPVVSALALYEEPELNQLVHRACVRPEPRNGADYARRT